MALREDYRELLLEAAVLVVSRDGLDHATTKAIAKEAACNEVYIYRNFGSKEGLLQAAFDRADIHFIQMVIKHLDVLDDRSMTLEQRCHALWQPVWAFCLSGPDIIPSAQRGAIDASEWIGPAEDIVMGLDRSGSTITSRACIRPSPSATCTSTKPGMTSSPNICAPSSTSA